MFPGEKSANFQLLYNKGTILNKSTQKKQQLHVIFFHHRYYAVKLYRYSRSFNFMFTQKRSINTRILYYIKLYMI